MGLFTVIGAYAKIHLSEDDERGLRNRLSSYVAAICIGTWGTYELFAGKIDRGIGLEAFAIAILGYFEIRELFERVTSRMNDKTEYDQRSAEEKEEHELHVVLGRGEIRLGIMQHTADTVWRAQVEQLSAENYNVMLATAEYWAKQASLWLADISSAAVVLSDVQRQRAEKVSLDVAAIHMAMTDMPYYSSLAQSKWMNLRRVASKATTIASTINREPTATQVIDTETMAPVGMENPDVSAAAESGERVESGDT